MDSFFFRRPGHHVNYIFSTDSPVVKAEWVTALNTSKLRLCKMIILELLSVNFLTITNDTSRSLSYPEIPSHIPQKSKCTTG